MLIWRVISALVALAVVLPTIYYSAAGVALLVAVAIAVSQYELRSMAGLTPGARNLRIFGVACFAGIFFLLIQAFVTPPLSFLAISQTFFICFVVTAGALLFEKKLDHAKIPKIVGTFLLIPAYVILPLLHFVFLRNLPEGAFWIYWIFVGTFAGDTGAYFVGKSFGKRKLAPHISPGKTWEGFYAQIISALLGSIVFWQCFMRGHPIRDAVAVGLICGLFGPLGDLFESMLKRGYGVKDSGGIMPGHGGLLDRIDGLLFTGPAVYYYVRWIYG